MTHFCCFVSLEIFTNTIGEFHYVQVVQTAQTTHTRFTSCWRNIINDFDYCFETYTNMTSRSNFDLSHKLFCSFSVPQSSYYRFELGHRRHLLRLDINFQRNIHVLPTNLKKQTHKKYLTWSFSGKAHQFKLPKTHNFPYYLQFCPYVPNHRHYADKSLLQVPSPLFNQP